MLLRLLGILGRVIKMKQYKVQITDKALADMAEVYNYIAYVLHSPENALAQYNRIAAAIEGLAIFPERNRVIEISVKENMKLRNQHVDNYSAFYVIEDDKVIVVRVLYSASDIEKRLREK